MGVKEFLAGALKRDTRFKELEKEMRIQKMVEERMKPANERELERYYEEERQKSIKENLEEFRKKQQEETWHGQNILDQKNIFKEKATMLTDNKKLLHDKTNILHDKKLFKLGKGKSPKKGGMFFK